MALFWRPLIDMQPSAHSPLRLRAITHVARWLAEPEGPRRSWFSMIGVPGQRSQVLRHAGLDHYDCRTPTQLPPALRTAEWSDLVTALERFTDLDSGRRALLVFHLAQLSFCQYAIGLCGDVSLDGDPEHDRYAYEVARVHARTPGHLGTALALFDGLARKAGEPELALAACFQGVGHSLRDGGTAQHARTFYEHAGTLTARVADGWHGRLVSSRFHRAAALLHLANGDRRGVDEHLSLAGEHHDALVVPGLDEPDTMVVQENARYLLELRIRIASVHDIPAALPACQALLDLDPNCVEALLIAGDAHAASGDYSAAAELYGRAGRLGTGAGALGWYRAGQCYEILGLRVEALHAMGRCLELDTAAVEPRAYISAFGSGGVANGAATG
jgi:tetratricopeptide (TPR) repeat protein